FIGVFLMWDIAEKPAKRLQQSLRDRILPHAFGFLADVRYQHMAQPASLAELPRAAIGSYNRSTIGDVIAGRFEELALEIFEGLLVGFQPERPYWGRSVAVTRSGSVTRWFRETFSSGDETIDFANPEIGAAFEVRASDPQAARRVVDGTLAKTLAFLRRTWPD